MAWTPIRTMRRGQRPDFTLLREPTNAYVTRAQRWFMDQILDLEPGTEDESGGQYAHKPGYHDTVAHNDARSGVRGDYSARDPQDRRGPRDKTRGWDWTFRDAQGGNYADFAKYGDRVLAAYRGNDPRLAGWREYLGRVSNAVTVNDVATKRVGIDFRHRYLRIPDNTHDWHAHGSESTEHVESFWNKWALLTVLAGWSLSEWRMSIEETDMDATQAKQLAELHAALVGERHEWAQGRNTARLMTDLGYAFLYGLPGAESTWLALAIAAAGDLDPAELARLRAELAAELAPVVTSLTAEIDAVSGETVDALVNRSPDEAARAIQATLGPKRAQELAEALLALGQS